MRLRSPLVSPLDPFHRALLLSPVDPRACILANAAPARVLGQPGRRLGPHAGLAVKDERLVLVRAREAVHVLKVLLRHMEALHCRRDGDVDGAGDLARLSELDGFADVYRSFISSRSFPYFLSLSIYEKRKGYSA